MSPTPPCAMTARMRAGSSCSKPVRTSSGKFRPRRYSIQTDPVCQQGVELTQEYRILERSASDRKDGPSHLRCRPPRYWYAPITRASRMRFKMKRRTGTFQAGECWNEDVDIAGQRLDRACSNSPRLHPTHLSFRLMSTQAHDFGQAASSVLSISSCVHEPGCIGHSGSQQTTLCFLCLQSSSDHGT